MVMARWSSGEWMWQAHTLLVSAKRQLRKFGAATSPEVATMSAKSQLAKPWSCNFTRGGNQQIICRIFFDTYLCHAENSYQSLA